MSRTSREGWEVEMVGVGGGRGQLVEMLGGGSGSLLIQMVRKMCLGNQCLGD